MNDIIIIDIVAPCDGIVDPWSGIRLLWRRAQCRWRRRGQGWRRWTWKETTKCEDSHFDNLWPTQRNINPSRFRTYKFHYSGQSILKVFPCTEEGMCCIHSMDSIHSWTEECIEFSKNVPLGPVHCDLVSLQDLHAEWKYDTLVHIELQLEVSLHLKKCKSSTECICTSLKTLLYYSPTSTGGRPTASRLVYCPTRLTPTSCPCSLRPT